MGSGDRSGPARLSAVQRRAGSPLQVRDTENTDVHVTASTRCFADQSFELAANSLWDLDFKHLEISVDDGCGQLTLTDLTDDPDAFVSRYRNATRATPDTFGLFIGPTPEQMESLCRTAKLLQVTQITVPSSEQGTPFNEEIDRLRKLIEIASVEGIRVSIATDPGRMTQDPHTAVELCQQVRGLGITYDPSHYIVSGQPMNVEQMASYIYHVRLRDTSTEAMQVSLGLGENDFAKIIGALEDTGYTQGLTIDLLPGHFDADARLLELRKMRRLLESQL